MVSLAQYKGIRISTKRGIKSGLLCRIPETRLAYSFFFQRSNKDEDVYRCCFCKAEGVRTTVKVIADEFLTDPCYIGHRCSLRPYVEESTKRMQYKKMDVIRSDDRYVNQSTKHLWLDGLREINEDSSIDDSLKNEMLAEYFGRGFDDKKQQFTRNLASHKDKRAAMAFVPEELENLSDGRRFLQDACRVGLQAIVADGVHTP